LLLEPSLGNLCLRPSRCLLGALARLLFQLSLRLANLDKPALSAR